MKTGKEYTTDFLSKINSTLRKPSGLQIGEWVLLKPIRRKDMELIKSSSETNNRIISDLSESLLVQEKAAELISEIAQRMSLDLSKANDEIGSLKKSLDESNARQVYLTELVEKLQSEDKNLNSSDFGKKLSAALKTLEARYESMSDEEHRLHFANPPKIIGDMID